MANFNIPMDCTVDHFFGIIHAMDWFYGFSDDTSVFLAGRERAAEVEKYAAVRGGLRADRSAAAAAGAG